VRGSTPCCSESNQRYGGNTSCVVVEAAGDRPVVLDLGTGLRFWGLDLPCDGSLDAIALVSHLHWDHVQGIPFFGPINVPGARLDLYGCGGEEGGFGRAVAGFMRPPYFPVTLDALAGTFDFHDAAHGDVIRDGGWTLTAREVPHVGQTLGWRIEHGGMSIAYVPDHQQPGCGSTYVDPAVLELAADVDLLIHDAQYTDGEFAQKHDWGHCTIDYALEVAAQAGARRLALFHHDPSHDDEHLDALHAHASRSGAARGLAEVLCAREGQRVSLSPLGAR
jgi:phosphoribosyl 1,2-cyclic phosphodiesterase